jgi:uncharacterized protein
VRAAALIACAMALVVGCAAAPSAPPAPDLDRALIDAAAGGDAGAVGSLLAQGAQVSARDGRGATALVRAAYGNHLEAAASLIAAGADVDLADDSRQSAYLISTSEVRDDPRLLEMTLAAGADVNAKDSYNGTGLIRAAERGHPLIVERLLAAGIDRDHINRLGYTALHEAVVFGEGGREHQATVAALVRGGVALDIPDGTGVTALAHAERLGQREIAAILRAGRAP